MGEVSWRALFVGIWTGLALASPVHAKEPNTLSLATATPKDKNFSAWVPYTESVTMRHAVLGKWAGGDTWVLFFSNGTGEDSCKELTQPTGDLLLTLVLPGPPSLEKKKGQRVELSDASLYVEAFNAAFPLFALDAKHVRFKTFEDATPPLVHGEIDVRGDHAELHYEVTGTFSARRCE